MLVVTRRNSQSVVITANSNIPAGAEIEVIICEQRSNGVRLGIQADREQFHILRGELVEASMGARLMKQQRQDAASATGTDNNG